MLGMTKMLRLISKSNHLHRIKVSVPNFFSVNQCMVFKINDHNVINSRIFFFLLCSFCFKTAFTQDSSYSTSRPVFAEASVLYDFPQSYGLSAGVNYPLKSVLKNRISKKGKLHTKQTEKFAGVNAAAYRYPFNYTGIFLMPFIGVRHYVHPSLFYETSLSVGVLRTFYDGRVYEVNAAGSVSQKSLFGRFYATTGFSWCFGFLLNKQGHSICALQFKPMLWFQYPYNSFIKPHISLEGGIKYEIAFRNVHAKKITKHKQ